MTSLIRTFAVFSLISWSAGAQSVPSADIYILGEIHDNPTHHAEQARLVAAIVPTAVVFEQLSDEQADRIDADTPRDPQVLDRLLDWSESGWPDIAFYLPIIAASDAIILGAAGAPGDLSAYGLDTALPPDQQAAREQLQADAHCGALPETLLPRFVARQRATDAQFAARTIAAFDAHGGPVVLITGNGHARTDWGVPAAIVRVRPDLRVVSVVQGEGEDTVPGDLTLQATAPARDAPCAAFR